MWQLKHQGWARRFELDAVAERARPPRRHGRRTHAEVKDRAVSTIRGKSVEAFRIGMAHQLHAVVQHVRSKLARPAAHVKIVNGKLDKASLLVALAGNELTRENTAIRLADQLRLPLYRVSLSALMMAGWGKAERVLARIFKAAARGDVVLYFDQADALFGLDKKTTKDKGRVMEEFLQHIALSRGLIVIAVTGRKKIEPMWVNYADYFFDL